MYARINSLGLLGLNAFPVTVEIESSEGLESFDIVGMADISVKESRERIRSAFRSSGINFPEARVLVNLAPADVKKTGAVHDLAIAVSVLRIMGISDNEYMQKSVFIGEVALNGEIRAVQGVLPMTIMARENGMDRIFVPIDNLREASVVEGIDCMGLGSLGELVYHLAGKAEIVPAQPYKPEKVSCYGNLDFADVRGQSFAKRALEVAAAGGHNVLMVGSPGSGKSMLSKCMPSILPAMTFEESIETTKIHSVAGHIDKNAPLITVRPFRAPHHTVSTAGLAGGGSIPKPGEISLAHNGLLFLDEMAEFSRASLEILRQPIEDQQVTISRAFGTITYPCSFMLIGAMNPCPCGYFGHPTRKCICSHKQVVNYLNKISGPLLDRFDVHIEVEPVEYGDLSSPQKEESSAAIRERVQKARDIQTARFEGTSITCNARITPDRLHEYCQMTDEARNTLGKVFDNLGLSGRAYDKMMKVARTVADMDNSEMITEAHVMQTVMYRSLDRKYWNE